MHDLKWMFRWDRYYIGGVCHRLFICVQTSDNCIGVYLSIYISHVSRHFIHSQVFFWLALSMLHVVIFENLSHVLGFGSLQGQRWMQHRKSWWQFGVLWVTTGGLLQHVTMQAAISGSLISIYTRIRPRIRIRSYSSVRKHMPVPIALTLTDVPLPTLQIVCRKEGI